MIAAIDFDGTVVMHEYPEIGAPVPGALAAMKEFQDAGGWIILWTMRSGETLADAVKYLESNGIVLRGINENPQQRTWTGSPKAYAHVYVDDAALGCPLKERMNGKCPHADWSVIGPKLMELLHERNRNLAGTTP